MQQTALLPVGPRMPRLPTCGRGWWHLSSGPPIDRSPIDPEEKKGRPLDRSPAPHDSLVSVVARYTRLPRLCCSQVHTTPSSLTTDQTRQRQRTTDRRRAHSPHSSNISPTHDAHVYTHCLIETSAWADAIPGTSAPSVRLIIIYSCRRERTIDGSATRRPI